ncbi:MAG: CotH kinase family protein, partial [Pirellulales bacterium]|nr:CotH kinase family protein [Pirellulales bacterium]
RRHYESAKGLLLKPEGTQGLEYLGDDWDQYEWYNAKTKPTPAQASHIIELARLINQADDAEFRERLAQHLDIDAFSRFLAANALMANMDSFLTQVHNYYVYLPAETNRAVFLPWDLDLSMGAFFLAGTPEQLQDLSIAHPHAGQNRLIERFLEVEEFDASYRRALGELAESQFGSEGAVTVAVPKLRAAIEPWLERERKAEEAAAANRPPGGFGAPFRGPGNPFSGGPPLETFLERRLESVRAQLAGRSQGFTPQFGFGPPAGGPGGPRGPGGPGGPPAFPKPSEFWSQPLTAALDADRNGLIALDELLAGGRRLFDRDGEPPRDSLSEDDFVERLAAALPPPPGGAPGGPPPVAILKFIFGPVFRAGDADGDGTLTPAEVEAALSSVFQKADADASADLNAEELGAAINDVFPPPPGQGPPPGGPPRP